MGCFDSVYVQCPACGKRTEIQSKAGDCSFGEYQLYNAPPAILGALHGEIQTCDHCNAGFTIRVQTLASIEYPLDTDEEEYED